MGVAALITFMLVLLGIFWFDKPLFVFLRQFNCRLFNWFDVVFAGKVWILVSFIAAAVLCVKKYLKSEVSVDIKNWRGSIINCFNCQKRQRQTNIQVFAQLLLSL